MFTASKVWFFIPTPLRGPAFGAVAAGNNASGSLTWSATDPVGALVIAYISVGTTSSVSSVTYGGTSMTLKTSIHGDNTSGDGTLYAYLLTGGGTGSAETVNVSFSPSTSIGTGTTVSYTNVTSVTATTADGSSASASQSATCTSGQMISQAFGANANDFTANGGGTERFNGSHTVASLHTAGLLIQDSTASATFTGTLAGSTQWSGIALVLG